MINKINKIIIAITFGFALFTFGASQTNAQTIQPNDGSFEYIKILQDGLAVKLTNEAINFGWMDWGAKDLAQRVKWWAERTNKACYAIKIDKLARAIRKHAAAYKLHIMRGRANPVNVSWREIM